MGYILKVKDDKGNVIGIPAIQGLRGKSVYDVAVDNGFEGTEEDFLRAICGKSAYEIACDNGFEGTEEDFLQAIGLRPWNVNENVGSIVVNPITIDDLPLIGDSANWEEKEVEYHENGTNIKRLVSTYGIEFPAINSGEVYLHLSFATEIADHSHNSKYTDHTYEDVYDEVLDDYVETLIDRRERTVEYVSFRVCVGGVPAKEYSRSFSDNFRVFDDFQEFLEEIFETVKTNPPLLSVSKGDTIRIEFEVCTTATQANDSLLYLNADKGHIFFGDCYNDKYTPDKDNGFTLVYLSANIDTPYKYIALIDKKDTSMEEILNALLGV